MRFVVEIQFNIARESFGAEGECVLSATASTKATPSLYLKEVTYLLKGQEIITLYQQFYVTLLYIYSIYLQNNN